MRIPKTTKKKGGREENGGTSGEEHAQQELHHYAEPVAELNDDEKYAPNEERVRIDEEGLGDVLGRGPTMLPESQAE